jgi:pilus assembly protein TadC
LGIYQNFARTIPELSLKLKQAGIPDEPDEYVKKIVLTSITMSVGLAFVIFLFFSSPITFLVVPILFPIFLVYFLKYVDVKIEQIKRKIDQEIIFAGRFLIIELDSGVPIYKAFENLEQNYEIVGSYFGDIMNKVYLGTNLEDAINETLMNSPSPNMRRVLWQILNSIKTGAEAGKSLNIIIDQIVREQQIAVKEYGKKLNPIAMFYMMVSIILPSIGTTMLVILATFMGLNITMIYFIIIAGLIAFMQFMFLSIIRSSRPPISG